MSSDKSSSPDIKRRTVLKSIGVASAGMATSAASTGATSSSGRGGFDIDVLSSKPEHVSGGDALLEVSLPNGIAPGDITVLRNGDDVTDGFDEHPERHSVTGVVDGLREGENLLEVQNTGRTVTSERVVNHPRIGPIFSGPNQRPFACTVDEELDARLIVDNQEGKGVPVTDDDGTVIGYSQHCQVDDQVEYVYRDVDGEFRHFDPVEGVPDEADLAQADVDGDTVDYVVRWERGTINRFVYSIAILDPDLDGGDEPGAYEPTDGWNGKLIYNFQGGVGIGHTQGRPDEGRMLRDLGLSQGYAVIYSTGNRTGDHYNLQVGGETALMVKEEFVTRYGEPEYTIGLGGSGGGIQQYVYAQNHPGLIDGAIPRVSYPDMVTQTIHVGDCELLEYFMDVLDGDNETWDDWTTRSWLIGLNGENDVVNPITGEPGATECTNAWRGLTPLSMNPNFGSEANWDRLDDETLAEIERTHWDDLRNVYGVGDDGFARRTWDNVGVQYGLQALKDGDIDPETFLRLNERIGGWKDSAEMVQEGFPFVPDGDFDPWSARNMTHDGDPAPPEPRVEGDLEAIEAAYREGIVFRGELDIPVIDWRPYMEEELDMHNTHQSFAARQRIIDHRARASDRGRERGRGEGATVGHGDADGHVIWFTDADGDLEALALEVMDEWLSNLQAEPDASLEETRPDRAADACFTGDEWEDGLIASGDGVWDGILNDDECGECTDTYPTYTTSRIEAGGPITGDYFKCQLKPVEAALEDGTYGDWNPTDEQIERLKAIFPDGVCDYEKPPAGLPDAYREY